MKTNQHNQQYTIELNGRRAGSLLGFMPPSRPAGDLVMSCGAGMSRDFYEWVSSGFSYTPPRRNGAVNPLPSSTGQRREFFNAVIAEVVLPALDKSLRMPAAMTVTVSQEADRLSPSPPGLVWTHPKPWFTSDFKLQIDGLEAECKHAASVGAVSGNTKVATDYFGSSRYPEKISGGPDFSKITVTLPVAAFDGFEKWNKDSVNRNSGSERKASLEYLSAGGGRPYFRLDFSGVGIAAVKRTAKNTTAVELYVRNISFTAQAAALSG